MPQKKESLERQLETARKTLSVRVQFLEDSGVSVKEFRKDPGWRQLKSRCRRIYNRLSAAKAVAAVGEKAAE